MSKPADLEIIFMAAALVSTAACDQTLRAGKVGNNINPPNSDGACSIGLTVCGQGAFAQCLDLQRDRAHCGTCGNACMPGIACSAGTCQQLACAGPVTVSPQTIPDSSSDGTAVPVAGAILADINGDGRPDLVTWTHPTGFFSAGSFQVALQEAGGGFGVATNYQAANFVDQILAGDSNADGFQDLYLSDSSSSPCLQIWLGHADGKLTATDTGMDTCANPMALSDLNGDGVSDIVASSIPSRVFLADANGNFHVGIDLPSQRNGLMVLVRDWNGDGAPDLVGIRPSLSVYLNRGNGTFEDALECGIFLSADWRDVVVADFNRDGHMDVAITIDNVVGALLGLGGCQFQPMAEYPVSESVSALAYGDVDGDGFGDLVARSTVGSSSLLHGAADGTFRVETFASAGACSGDDCVVLVGEVTGDGKVDVVVAGGSEIWIEGGTGKLVVSPTQVLGNTCP